MNSRIQPIDGLRAFAAFGVVWIHVWSFFKNPAVNFLSIDLYKLFAIVGNGVDFFFVISGFCMYLMTYKKNYNFSSYLQFLFKRFSRIAPAFYVAVIVYALIIKYYNPPFYFWYNVFFHLIFLNNVVTGNTIIGPFWSIGTEWHFYMLLPLLIYLSTKLSLIRSVILISICCIIFFCFINLGYLQYGWWETQILVRFPEFGVGIIACYCFIKAKKLPQLLKGVKGIIIAVLIMYTGRFMKFTPVLEMAGKFSFLLKSLADTVMTAGFGIILFHVISEKSFLSKALSGKFITYLGRISFSIYLWHSLAILILTPVLSNMRFDNLNPVPGFIIVSILTVLISHFSYKYLEAFYFNRKKTAGIAASTNNNIK